MEKKYSGVVDISNEDYHAEKNHLSSSNLKMLLKDLPGFYNQKILGNKAEHSAKTQAIFDEGSYAHTLLLEPHLADEEYKIYPGWRKQGRDWIEFKEENKDFTILSKPQKIRVEKWVASAKKLKVAMDILKGGAPEQTIFSELGGVPVKARADYVSVEGGYIADVKTTSQGADKESFDYTISNFSYDLSAAFYLNIFEAYYGKKFDFYFVVLDKRDASTEVFKLSEETRAAGDEQVFRALGIYKKCKKNNNWEPVKKHIKKEEISDDEYEILLV